MLLASETGATSRALQDIYCRLFACYGPQHWWPADEPFEVMVGAILTQSTSWTNVEKAITSLKSAGALSPRALRQLPQDEVARLIHSCGYHNVKARRLKSFVQWLGEVCGDDLDRLFAARADELRKQLLSVYGVGEETADSILLYAGGKPVFVIDAYTRRITSRVGLSTSDAGYGALQSLFTDNLPADAALFNEYHALLVRLGKEVCRPGPVCQRCCLGEVCKWWLRQGECKNTGAALTGIKQGAGR
ncbi:MAG: endonuclease [Chloroflexi bacterium]|nr:endonuclease [Chloroflexota bacterium]